MAPTVPQGARVCQPRPREETHTTPDQKLAADAQAARIRPNPDGTLVYRDPDRAALADLAVPSAPLRVGTQGWVDDYTACQLGLAQILQGLTFHVVSLTDLVERGVVQANTMAFGKRVFLDHPDPEDERVPTPSATITEAQPTELTTPGPLSGQGYDEDSVGAWGEGTVLRVGYHATHTYSVVCWLAHKDERAAVRLGLQQALAVEPRDAASDRRVVLPWYFGQSARYTLKSMSYPDTDELAVRGTWPLVAEVQAEVVQVTLVESPGYLREPTVRLP